MYALICLTSTTQACADSWLEPHSRTVASPDANTLLRIDLKPEKVGSGTRYNTRAIWLRWNASAQSYEKLHDIALKRLIAPLRSVISNDGQVVLIDRWYGNNDLREPVVLIYAATGALIQQWRLAQLYPDAVLSTLPQSSSTINWVTAEPYLRNGALMVPEARGGEFSFDLRSGAFTYKAKFAPGVPNP
jgi:hypothetical protein